MAAAPPDTEISVPVWAAWNSKHPVPYTIGLEEEVLLLEPEDGSLAERSDDVLSAVSPEVARHLAPETHAGIIELVTDVHEDVPAAVAQLTQLRVRLADALGPLGLSAACAGLHPFAPAGHTRTSAASRYQAVSDTMRSLARREPTAALHVHIGVPDPDEAIRLLNRLRETVPVLLALSANSPFSRGRDSGFASMRNRIFSGFPRTGIPPRYADYSDYVRTLDPLMASGALPDPTFLWWDVRLQPALGTVELRVMDAQTDVEDTAALAALVHTLARLGLSGGSPDAGTSPEVLSENAFLGARDGVGAKLVNPVSGRLVPMTVLADRLLEACLPHAEALGCVNELEGVRRLALINGAKRQRAWVRSGRDLPSLVAALAERFTAQPELVAFSSASTERSP